MSKIYEGIPALRVAMNGYMKAGCIEHTTIQYRSEYLSPHGRPSDYTWAQYSLQQLPGCCGAVVSTGAVVQEWQRNKGLGEYFHKERLELMKEMGYSCGVATTVTHNKHENRILEKNGWKVVHTFRNKRTSNVVQLWVKDLA